MRIILVPIHLALALLLACQAMAANWESGVERIDLIELYTSEGCSSCPPADRWLSNLTTHDGLWSEFIPIALHVDYWDYIGWQDPFALKENTQRQRQHNSKGNTRGVYTPGFLRNGLEWRPGQKTTSTQTMPGKLSLEINNKAITLRFLPQSTITQSLKAHIVLLGMNIESNVSHGENRGKLLKHNFVALKQAHSQNAKHINKNKSDLLIWLFPLKTIEHNNDSKKVQYAIASWVEDKNLQPLQSVGGLLKSQHITMGQQSLNDVE